MTALRVVAATVTSYEHARVDEMSARRANKALKQNRHDRSGTHRMSVSVLKRNQLGIGRFCFIFLPKRRFTLKLFCDGCEKGDIQC